MTVPVRTKYQAVAVSQTDKALGTAGATGDRLDSMVISVATAANSAVSMKDGSGSAIVLLAANTPIGVYNISFGPSGIASTGGAWSLTTASGVTVLATGEFT